MSESVVYKYTKVCKDCGKTYGTNGAASYRCTACAKIAEKKRKHELNVEAQQRRKAAAAILEEEKKRQAERMESKPKVKICPYCGEEFTGSEDYCEDCMEDGFNEVHKMFGATNGWDAKERVTVEIEDGWRGRKVVGGYASGVIHAE